MTTEIERLRGEVDASAQGVQAARAEKKEIERQISEYQRRQQQQEKAMNDLRTQSQKKIAQLQSQMEKHKSDLVQAKNQVQQKSSKEVELEMRLDEEVKNREKQAAEKDAQIFSLQKEAAEKAQVAKAKEVECQQLSERLEEKASEIITLQATHTVLAGEKEKQQRLWESSMNDHFSNLNDVQQKHGDLDREFVDFKTEAEKKQSELLAQLSEYKAIVAQVSTKKEGLLRKQTRNRRLFGQKWNVKHFRLVGCTLLYSDPGMGSNANAEKAFQITSATVLAQVNGQKHAFSIKTGDDQELILAAIDKNDLTEWLSELESAITDLRGKSESEQRKLQKLGSDLQEGGEEKGAAEDDDE